MLLELELLREELPEELDEDELDELEELEELELLEEVSPVTTVTSLSELLEEDCLVDSITFSEEMLDWLPSHLLWITSITPPERRVESAWETACCKAVLVLATATL